MKTPYCQYLIERNIMRKQFLFVLVTVGYCFSGLYGMDDNRTGDRRDSDDYSPRLHNNSDDTYSGRSYFINELMESTKNEKNEKEETVRRAVVRFKDFYDAEIEAYFKVGDYNKLVNDYPLFASAHRGNCDISLSKLLCIGNWRNIKLKSGEDIGYKFIVRTKRK